MGYVPTVDPSWVGPERLVALATPAIEEALERPSGAPWAAGEARISAYIALDQDVAEPRVVRAGLEPVLHRLLPGATVHVEPKGEGALGAALPELIRSLESGALDAALVGGVHSDYDPATIRALESSGRLFSRENLDARVPGEAAAFVLLMRAAHAHRLGFAPLAHIVGVGGAEEKIRADNDEPAFRAFGLSAAVRQATAPLLAAKQTAGWYLVDLTAEMWRLHEWEAVFVRSHRVLGRPYRIEAPAQRLGYLGAAAMPLFMALAATAWQYGYAPCPTALATATADRGQRVAMVLQSA